MINLLAAGQWPLWEQITVSCLIAGLVAAAAWLGER